MKLSNLKIATLLIAVFLISCNSNTSTSEKSLKEKQSTEKTASTEMKANTAVSNNQLEVIQFHSTNRCKTCQKIEKLTQVVLEDYENVRFKLVSVDKKENEAMVERFEASGTALFLHNTNTKQFKNLTEFAFMNAGNEKKFKNELKAEIAQF